MVRDNQSGEVTSESRFMLKHTARLIRTHPLGAALWIK
jgi:hypothetical protein